MRGGWSVNEQGAGLASRATSERGRQIEAAELGNIKNIFSG
jgi:hypothetical protein